MYGGWPISSYRLFHPIQQGQMNFTTQYANDLAARASQISPLSILMTIRAYYLRYLWNYESDSWVARMAYACRVLAVLISLPLVVLALLDISSYILARTLGVVDDVRASTSDKVTAHEAKVPPVIRVQDFDEDVSFGESRTFADPECSLECAAADNRTSDEVLATLQATQPTVFYAGGDDQSNLKLSGIEVFSPAGSQPPSPTFSRKRLAFDGKEHLRNRLQHVEKDGE